MLTPKTPLLALLFAGTLQNLCAATVITTGEDIEWSAYRSKATPKFSYVDGATTISNLDAASYVWGYLPAAARLGEGDSISLTGTATFASVTQSGVFYFGLYNSGANARPAAGTTFDSIRDATYGMTGFFAGTTTDGSKTTVYSRFQEKQGGGFMETNQGANYIVNSVLETALEAPSAASEYNFTLVLTRNWGGGYIVSLSTEGETVSFESEKSLSATDFDVIGFKSPGGGITFSNLSVSTTGTAIQIPEPSACGMLFGLGVLAATLLPRRRSHRKRS